MAALQNIVFDLGGVLLDIDYKRTANAFRDLGFSNFDEMYSQSAANALFQDLETGKISTDAFYDNLAAAGKGQLTRETVSNAWNAMLLDFRLESLRFLEQIRDRYKLFLLSNTNAIHQYAFGQLFTQQTAHSSLNRFFTKAYYSHEIGLRKPNADIFTFLLDDAGIKAAETLFIDDTASNIEAAQKLGFKTHLLLPGQLIEALDYAAI